MGFLKCMHRILIKSTKYCGCLDYGDAQILAGEQHAAVSANKKATTCNEKESCILCRGRDAFGKSVERTELGAVSGLHGEAEKGQDAANMMK